VLWVNKVVGLYKRELKLGKNMYEQFLDRTDYQLYMPICFFVALNFNVI